MTKQQDDLEHASLIFERARELEEDARRAYLDEACNTNAALRAEILSMLEAEAGQGKFLSDPTLSVSRPLSEGPGTVIGHYKLLQLIGQGGFGVVYMAEQKAPVRRKVALKIIKIGMDTRQVVARFEAERQALALMDHPNIARVLDAGATETGRPFFVMELVKGVSIVEYCDTENLSTKDRLDLFIQVCNAVQHAHQKGIIHRDIKPSNVMVTLHDGKPVPKVIDFGIAKATDRELTDKTLFTEYRQFIGTPAYMSPEQAEMSGLDIDTRCDIYSLGVLLYELLTSTTPFDAMWLRSMAISELQRVIREEEPPRPSTRLSTMCKDPAEARGEKQRAPGETSKSSITAKDVARHRHTDVQSLTRQLRGDLDWIVLRCLEKDRTRRYATANELSADIQCHLRDEPVVASPPSATYRFRKLVRRNRGAFVAGSAIAMTILLGLAFATAGFVSARRAHVRLAEEVEQTRAIAGFFTEMFESVNPLADGMAPAPFTEVTVEDLLGSAEPLISSTFADKPQLEAQVRSTLAQSYSGLGRFEQAEAQARRSLELRERVLGEDAPETLWTRRQLAYSMMNQGRSQEGVDVLRAAVNRCGRALDPDDPLLIRMKATLGYLLWFVGNLEEAEPLTTDSLERAERVLGNEDRDTISTRTTLGIILKSRGRFDQAEILFRDSMRTARSILRADVPLALFPAFMLADCLAARGQYDEATALLSETVEGYRRAFGEGHPWMGQVRSMHAHFLYEQGDSEGALALLDEILATQRNRLGEDYSERPFLQGIRVVFLIELGRLDVAEGIARNLVETAPVSIQNASLQRTVRATLGWVLLERAQLDQAEPLLRDALDEQLRHLPGGSQNTPWYRWLLGRCQTGQARFVEAEPLLLAAYESERSMRGADHKYAKRCADSLTDLYKRWGKPDQIEAWRVAGSKIAPDSP